MAKTKHLGMKIREVDLNVAITKKNVKGITGIQGAFSDQFIPGIASFTDEPVV